MKHVIIGGDGFLGKHLARELVNLGQQVVICDINKSDLDIYQSVPFIQLDITDPSAFEALSLDQDDIVHHYAARLLMPIVPRKQRDEYFWSVNYGGTKNVFEAAYEKGCHQIVFFTTDMVYGRTVMTPKFEDHPRKPLGPYGASKLAAEELCGAFRQRGMNITLFRPRLIIGPERLGILENLFRLIKSNLPVPVIGNGSNFYQFVSVFDCVNAVLCAVENGIPSNTFNLGTTDPPTVSKLLGDLIEHARSKSFLLRTPAGLVKRTLDLLDFFNMPLMDPEQYIIADESCILDVSKAERELGWKPSFRDEDMLIAAYDSYQSLAEGGGQELATVRSRRPVPVSVKSEVR